MKPSIVSKGKCIAWNILRPSLLIFLVIAVMLLAGAVNQVIAQSPLITESSETSPYDLMETQGDQISLDSQTSTGIFLYEDGELSALDPSTIPESSPDADWLFEVPIEVSQMSEEVQGLNVFCVMGENPVNLNAGRSKAQAFYTFENPSYAGKEVPLENGSFHGSVTIGINAQTGDKYMCRVLLIGPNGGKHWPEKAPDEVSSESDWWMANPNKPFKVETGVKSLPK